MNHRQFGQKFRYVKLVAANIASSCLSETKVWYPTPSDFFSLTDTDSSDFTCDNLSDFVQLPMPLHVTHAVLLPWTRLNRRCVKSMNFPFKIVTFTQTALSTSLTPEFKDLELK